MGCQVHGPVNGLEEGFPEYEVPRALLDKLKSNLTGSTILTLSASISRPYPGSHLIHRPPQLPTNNVISPECIDPSLLQQLLPTELASSSNITRESPIQMPINPEPETLDNPMVPDVPIAPSLLGKRNQMQKSPPKRPVTQSTCRKVITADDCAMKEAEAFMT